MALVNESARSPGTGRAPEWARKYPPLVALVVGLVIALAILPSALNLPQSNPQETVEYAPVPPQDKQNNDTSGNLAALGLAGSSTVGGAGAPGGAALAPLGTGDAGLNPGVQCYGNPPRQTEDPLSPPCVGYFTGDNFGATYQGVTKSEVRVIVFIEGNVGYTSASDPTNRSTPNDGRCIDLAKPPDPKLGSEHLTTKGLRVWQAYFNRRFQTYRRAVYFTVCYSTGTTPEARRQDATNDIAKVKPFASSVEIISNEDDYLREMSRKGVLNFGSFALRPESYYNAFPKTIWSRLPSVEQQVDRYVSYICQKVVNKPSVIAGPDLNGRTRTFGMIRTTDTNQPGALLMAQLVKQKTKGCGANYTVADATFPDCCWGFNTTENPSYAESQMAQYKAANVTTVIWPGGINPNYGRAANGIGYVPEWVVLGDAQMDGFLFPSFRGNYQAEWDHHAIVVSPETYHPAFRQERCYQAFRSVTQQMADVDVAYVCDYYANLFQLFVGIQVAGPRLGPTSIDQGFHAIPQRYNSTDPTVPSCFYLPGDYTCIKDAEAMLWSAADRAPGQTEPGCWLTIESGKRYAPGKWPPGNVDAQFQAAPMPCNGYSLSLYYKGP